MAETINKNKLTPALREYLEKKENEEKTPLIRYMEKQKERGQLLSSADMQDGEDMFSYLDRKQEERKVRNERTAQYNAVKDSIDPAKAAETVKNMAFSRNMPQTSAADRFRKKSAVEYTAPMTYARIDVPAPENGYQMIAQDMALGDVAKLRQKETEEAERKRRIEAARSVEEVYSDIDKLKTRRDAFDKTEAANDIADAINDLNMQEQKELLEANRITDKSRAEVDAIRADIQKKYAALRKDLENSGEYEGLNREKRLLERELRDSYSKVRSEDDFEQFSGYSTTANSEEHKPIITQSGVFAGMTGYDDWIYEYINKNPDLLEAERNSRNPYLGNTKAASAMGYDLSFLQSMTEEEIGTYNYLYSTEGKESAEEYLEFIQSDLYARQRKESEEKYSAFAKEHPILASAASIASNATKGATYLGQAVDYLADGEIDPNASYNKPAYSTNAMRNTVSQLAEEKWGPVGSFAYQTGMSMADFLTAAGMTGGTGLSLLIMGSGAAADTTLSALERGVDSGAALALGALAGTAEALTEKISIDALFKGDWDKKALKYILKNALAEGSEEAASDIINTAADVLISGDKSEWQMSVRAYMDEGFSQQDAFKYTFLDKMKEIGLDALGGALSGAIMASTGVGIRKAGEAAAEADERNKQLEMIRKSISQDTEERAAEKRARAGISDVVLPSAEDSHKGIVLPTADDTSGETDSGEIVTGMEEPQPRLMTYSERRLEERIKTAKTTAEHSGLRLGVKEKDIKAAKALSERIGRDIIFYSDTSADGKNTNGYYDPESGAIYINKDAGTKKTVSFILGHELMHTLEQTQAYNELTDRVIIRLKRDGVNIPKKLEEVMDVRERAGKPLDSAEEAVTEIVADYVGDTLLKNSAAIRELVREKPSLAHRLGNALEHFAMQLAGTEDYVELDYIDKDRKALAEAEKEAEERALVPVSETETETEKKDGGENNAEPDAAVVTDAGEGAETAGAVAADAEVKAHVSEKTDDTVSGRTVTEEKKTAPRETVKEEESGSEKAVNASDAPLPTGWDEYLSDIEAQYEAGEITEEERDEAYSYAEEARDTGVPFDRASVKVEDVEGMIPSIVREKIVEPLKNKLRFSVSDYSASDFTYNSLTSKPDMKITQMAIPAEYNGSSTPLRKTVIQAALKNARTQNNPRNTDENVFVRNRDTGIDILINNSSISHGLNRKYANNAIASANIASLLENAVLVNRHSARDGVNEGGVYLSAGRYGGELYISRIITNDNNVMEEIETMYALNAKKEPVAHYRLDSTGKPLLDTDSTISIADLLGIVKKYFADVLPDDVLNEIGMKRPASTVSDSVKYSVSDVSEEKPERLSTFLPANAMSRLRKGEEAFAKTLAETFVDRKNGVRDADFVKDVKTRLRGISSEYIKYGTAPDVSLDEMFREFNTAETPEAQAWQFSVFDRAVKEFQKSLGTVKRFADSKSENETVEKVTKQYTQEEAEKLFEAQRNAHKVLDQVRARSLLTEEDKIVLGKIRRGEMSLGQLSSAEYNVDDIRDMLEAQQAFDEADKQVKLYQKQVKAGYLNEADEALANISGWKDKAFMAYARETIDRNFSDVIKDEAEYKAFADKYIKPVHKAEAARQRMLADYRDRVKSLNLSQKPADGEKVSESYAVQLLGEAEDNIKLLEKMRKSDAVRDGRTLDEWKSVVKTMWAENPSLDQTKIRNAVDEFRKIYDELLKQMNEVLVRNGCPPVRYRSGYFPHFTAGSEDSVMAKFSRVFGIKLEVNPLPTSINGLTQDFKPGKPWFSHALERTGFETVYDAVDGFEQYIGGVSDVIHHTENIQRYRALTSQIRWLSGDEGMRKRHEDILNDETRSEEEKESRIREIYEEGRYSMSNLALYLDEYTNRLANKKSSADRGMEKWLGRKSYTIMKNIESRVAANMIGLNIGSALTNIIPLNQAQAVIGPIWTARGMWDALQNLRENDGLAPQSDFLVTRRGSDPLGMTFTDVLSNIAGKPMEWIDNFVSESIVRAAYLKNLDAGMSEELALEDADAVAASLMADRSKGALPLIFDIQNPVAKLFTQFQVEVNNEFSVLFKDIPKGFKEKGLAKLAAVYLAYFVGAKIFNDVYERLLGRRPSLDPIEMLNDAVGGITGKQLPNVLDMFKPEAWETERENPADVIEGFASSAAGSLPFAPSMLSLIGFETDGGRMPIQSAMPDIGALVDAAFDDGWSTKRSLLTAGKELGKPLTYLLLPTAGGTVKKVAETGIAALRGGVYGVQDMEVEQEDGTTKIVGEDYLKYPFYTENAVEAAVNFARSLSGGTSTTTGGQEWVESGFKTLTTKETELYRIMQDAGVGQRKAWDLLWDIKQIPKDVTSKTAEICRIIADADLDDETAEIIYRQKVTDKDVNEVRSAKLAGISFDKYLKAKSAYEEIDASETEVLDKTVELDKYLEREFASANQRAVMHSVFAYSASRTSVKNYRAIVDAGVTKDRALEIAEAIEALEPLEGKTTVSSAQRARAVLDTVEDEDDRAAALAAVLKDDYKKYGIANSLGVDFDAYTSFREVLPSYDEDGNSSYSQAEIQAAIESMSGVIDPNTMILMLMRGEKVPDSMNLTTAQKAVLWQLATGSKLAKNNPYSTEVGNKVIEMLYPKE